MTSTILLYSIHADIGIFKRPFLRPRFLACHISHSTHRWLSTSLSITHSSTNPNPGTLSIESHLVWTNAGLSTTFSLRNSSPKDAICGECRLSLDKILSVWRVRSSSSSLETRAVQCWADRWVPLGTGHGSEPDLCNCVTSCRSWQRF